MRLKLLAHRGRIGLDQLEMARRVNYGYMSTA